MYIHKILVAAMITTSCVGAVQATTTHACPEVNRITQRPGEFGGFAYTALGQDGKQWIGENPMAEEEDLQHVVFTEAYIHNTKNFVSCDYTATRGRGMRMALKAHARPIGAYWNIQKQPDGADLPRCIGPAPALCTFETLGGERF